MSDDIIFLEPDEEGKLPAPGRTEIRGGVEYITCVYIEPGRILSLPSGRTITHIRIFVNGCLTKLYNSQKARDN